MTDYIIRPLTINDAHQAAKLWHLVFGDEEAVVLEFFRLFAHTPHFGICAEQNGTIAAAAYCPSGTDYISPDGTASPGAYLYAVATHPDHRKRGLAAALCLQLRDQCFRNGEILFTKPSEESLYPWYEEKIGAKPMLGGQRLEFSAAPVQAVSLQCLSPAEYFHARNRYLQGLPHVRHSINWMHWEAALHQAYGGAFYAFGNHIADTYRDGNTLQINELLPPPTLEEAERLAQILMHHTNTDRCVCTLYGSEHYVSAAAQDGKMVTGWFGGCYG